MESAGRALDDNHVSPFQFPFTRKEKPQSARTTLTQSEITRRKFHFHVTMSVSFLLVFIGQLYSQRYAVKNTKLNVVCYGRLAFLFLYLFYPRSASIKNLTTAALDESSSLDNRCKNGIPWSRCVSGWAQSLFTTPPPAVPFAFYVEKRVSGH